MQLVRCEFLNKGEVITSAVRNTSCSRGWLRIVVQTIFALVTVASFILIVIMSIRQTFVDPPLSRPGRCNFNNCMVLCKEAPYYGEYEDDIIKSVGDAATNCNQVFLVLNRPAFINATMPVNFLSRMRITIRILSINGGNLMHIPPDAFMSQFTGGVRSLIFLNLTIRTLVTDSLVGLLNLNELYIKGCNIVNVQAGALRAVDDTLKTLTITDSNYWNPVNITGITNLAQITTVDFSSNYFYDVLDRDSFVGIASCKFLYLNSCRITAIGPGTFDTLKQIEVIFLNNNYLLTLPPGLFDTAMSLVNPRPRINLQDNLWHCDCSMEDLKSLVVKDLLLVDPFCQEPASMKGKSFTEFEQSCNNQSYSKLVAGNVFNVHYSNLENDYVEITEVCDNDTDPSESMSLRVLSPSPKNKCASENIQDVKLLRSFSSKIRNDVYLTETSRLRVKMYLSTQTYSMVQVDSQGSNGHGLIWYQTSCPNEIYCINVLPKFIRVYNVDDGAHYTFCPILLSSGLIEEENCIGYNLSDMQTPTEYRYFQVLMYISTAIVCLIFGALCVYGLIRNNPALLKGSKRLVFVKHKTVEALVLPPKVPLRDHLINGNNIIAPYDEKKIFILPSNNKVIEPNIFMRNKSIRSNGSNSPSYISALQPTEDQLAEWRVGRNLDYYSTISSMTSDLSTVSWIYNGESLVYSLEMDNDVTYESLK